MFKPIICFDNILLVQDILLKSLDLSNSIIENNKIFLSINISNLNSLDKRYLNEFTRFLIRNYFLKEISNNLSLDCIQLLLDNRIFYQTNIGYSFYKTLRKQILDNENKEFQKIMSNNENNSEKFWMLKALKGGNPTYIHRDYDTALNEARKLSGILNDKVFILEAVQIVEVTVTDLNKKEPEIQEVNDFVEALEEDSDIPPF